MSDPSGMRPARSSADSGSALANRSASSMRSAWRRSSGAWFSAIASLSTAITTARFELAIAQASGAHCRDRHPVTDIDRCKGFGLAKVDLAFTDELEARPERARLHGGTRL